MSVHSDSRKSSIARSSLTLFAWLTVTAAFGCDSEQVTAPPVEGVLTIEVRDSATLRIDAAGLAQPAGPARISIMFSETFGLLPASFEADVLVEPIPETGDLFYSAKHNAPAIAGGPCGGAPISLALSLHRKVNQDEVLGGITAYCGADTWYGTPARVLRLAGPLSSRTASSGTASSGTASTGTGTP